MRVPDEAHIVPVGSELTGAIDRALSAEADIVYLIDDPGTETVVEAADERLSAADIATAVLSCEHDKVARLTGIITTLAAKHDGDYVLVNAGTGRRQAIVAAFIADADPTTSVTLYPEMYAETALPGGMQDRPVSTARHPGFQLADVTRDALAGAAIILAHEESRPWATIKKRSVIDAALAVQQTLETDADATPLTFVEGLGDSTRHRTADVEEFADLRGNERKRAYRKLKTRVIEPLASHGYIEITSHGQADSLELTETGRSVLKAFRHEVRDVLAALEADLDADRWPDWLRKGVLPESVTQDEASPDSSTGLV